MNKIFLALKKLVEETEIERIIKQYRTTVREICTEYLRWDRKICKSFLEEISALV